MILYRARRRRMDTLMLKLSWLAFSELLDKYRDRVLNDMNTGLVLFTDSSVAMRVPATALGKTDDTTVH